MPTAHELVARGAELLDEKLPGWADQIDLESLEMRKACSCVLGQLGGRRVNLDALGWHDAEASDVVDFYMVRDRLGLDAVGLGFDAPTGADIVVYDDLQDAWKGEIVARRTLGDVS